ncbi:MAG: TonB-dependent receptor plug domain-containing protein [Gemmatimonadetes bacterium]|nr:carboxypeptidase regulatory-like domain-containing protein [Gemmatimonadota bacterium]NNM05433.1 TonB-dependent receptor plug domain-containing protein [Gemmatimonadota bacterium]
MSRRSFLRRPRASLHTLAMALLLAGVAPGSTAGQDRAPPLDRVVGLELSEMTLRDALNAVQRATGSSLIYSPDFVPVNRRVSCPCTDLTLRESLRILLRGTNLIFDALGNQVRISPRRPEGQEAPLGIIVGLVMNEETEAPIPNVLVQLSDGRGSLSNENGRFILVNVPPGTYSMTVSGLGWVPDTIPSIRVGAGETTPVEVRLTLRVIPLSGLVVSPGTFVILDDTKSVALQTLTREQIETVPQVGEDVFRSLKRLPGIASGDISTRLYLRGGQDRETLILLDGMELYEPYHMKDFEGALGIVDINAVGGINLHAGGFPVDFGDRAAGVFDMETRAPPTEGTRTTLGLSITNATVMSQGGFANGRGQWLFSARRGYMDIAFKLTDVDNDISPKYYDLLGKVKYQFGSRHLLSAHILHAVDDLELDPDVLSDSDGDDGEVSTGWGNTYGWITWKAFLSQRIRAQTVASVGRISRSRVGFISDPGRVRGPEMVDVLDKADYEFAGLKQDWTVDFTDRVALRTGFLTNRLSGHYDYSNRTRTLVVNANGDLVGVPDSVDVEMDPTGTEVELYGALRFKPVSWGTAEVGLRYDKRTHTDDSDLSPRIHAMADLGDRTALRVGWGVYHQSQGMHELEAGDGETSFAPSERALQTALGLEHELSNGITARVELYHRKVERPRRMYLNLWREILPFPELDGDRVRLDPTESRARGLELLIRKEGEAWDWSASYALSSTETLIEGTWAPQYWDQTHALAITLGWRPTPNWTLTGAFQVHSGWPFTPQIIQFDTVSVFQGTGGTNSLRWREEFGGWNSDRLPAYHRLDLRVTRQFRVKNGRLDLYLDLFNAYDQQNLRSFEYGTDVVGSDLKWVRWPDEELLPFLPSIGFRWEF